MRCQKAPCPAGLWSSRGFRAALVVTFMWMALATPMITPRAADLAPLVVEAKKTKPLATPYPREVQHAVRCAVCEQLVAAALGGAVRIVDAANARGAAGGAMKRSARYALEDTALSMLHGVCNPFSSEGEWIRRLTIVVDAGRGPRQQGETVSIRVSRDFLQCQRSCYTIAEVCTALLDTDEADDFATQLIRAATELISAVTTTGWDAASDTAGIEAERALRASVCRAACRRSSSAGQGSSAPAAVIRDPRLLQLISAERPRRIDANEKEIEEMLDSIERGAEVEADADQSPSDVGSRGRAMGKALGGRKADVFSRDEIFEMSRAFARGDKELLLRMDPSIADLSDEEFESLREMVGSNPTLSQSSPSHRTGERGRSRFGQAGDDWTDDDL